MAAMEKIYAKHATSYTWGGIVQNVFRKSFIIYIIFPHKQNSETYIREGFMRKS